MEIFMHATWVNEVAYKNKLLDTCTTKLYHKKEYQMIENTKSLFLYLSFSLWKKVELYIAYQCKHFSLTRNKLLNVIM